LLCSNLLHAQQKDAVGTIAVQVEKKINRTFSLAFFNQYGFNENYTEAGFALYDFGTNIKLNNNFSLGLNYRAASIRTDANTYAKRTFYYSDINWNKHFGDISINIRSRFVTKMYGAHLNEALNYKTNNHYLRNKIQLKYAINYTYSCFVSGEQIYRLDSKDETEQFRYSGGVSYQFDNKNKVQLAFTLLEETNTKTPDIRYITGLTYYFKF
jgi:hypothetical protein